jgi:hypothetical protein
MKKAAWEICGGEFMNNLMENDGRLSAHFESEVAAMARSLIDQYAAKFVKEPNNDRENSEASKHELSLNKFNPGNQHECRLVQENCAEVSRASRNAKLSAAMKGKF